MREEIISSDREGEETVINREGEGRERALEIGAGEEGRPEGNFEGIDSQLSYILRAILYSLSTGVGVQYITGDAEVETISEYNVGDPDWGPGV